MLPGLASPAEKGVSTFRLLPGTALSTSVHVLDSGRPGRVALIVGGIHGDEPAGIEAARQLSGERPLRGKRIVIVQANRPAAEAGLRTPAYMQDLNRSFPGRKTGTDTERLAASIMTVVARYRPDIVIDLHEAAAEAGPERSEIANSLILSEEGRAAEIVLAVVDRIDPAQNDTVFSFLAGAPAGSLNREVSQRFNIPVITVETARNDPLARRVARHFEKVKRILEVLESREGALR